MIVIPAIDLRRNQVVRLFQGKYDQEKEYGLDPCKVAEGFLQSGAKLIHLVDLDAARTGEPCQKELVLDLVKKVKIDFELGGGIRTIETIRNYLEGGVRRVIIGTAAHREPKLVEQAIKEYPGRIVIGIDARRGKVAVQGWEEGTGVDALELAKRYDRPEIAAIIYTEIEKDGTLKGPDIAGTLKLARSVKVPVVASGGVSCLDDLLKLKKEAGGDISGVIVGKAIYEGKLELAEAVKLVS
jgi:phosphoribosylformimino-5-aminoimidazole carboxamide ribotide isomerase